MKKFYNLQCNNQNYNKVHVFETDLEHFCLSWRVSQTCQTGWRPTDQTWTEASWRWLSGSWQLCWLQTRLGQCAHQTICNKRSQTISVSLNYYAVHVSIIACNLSKWMKYKNSHFCGHLDDDVVFNDVDSGSTAGYVDQLCDGHVRLLNRIHTNVGVTQAEHIIVLHSNVHF